VRDRSGDVCLEYRRRNGDKVQLPRDSDLLQRVEFHQASMVRSVASLGERVSLVLGFDSCQSLVRQSYRARSGRGVL